MIYFVFRCKQFVWMGNVSKLTVDGVKWVQDVSVIDKDFIKTMMRIVIKDIYLKQMLNIQKVYMVCIVICHSSQKE